METPLTRQARPDYFEPKIVELYRHLFHELTDNEPDESLPSEGFWREFFLLKPDKQKLYDVLEPLSAGSVIQIQTHTRLFFRRAIEEAGSGISPRNENALENLTAFLCAVLSKRYMNPSTDVIEVLAGLDAIDKSVSDLVQGLEAIIRQSINTDFRRKAVSTALAMVSGLYHTALVAYFIHRDLFPALMKYTHESPEGTAESLVLLGLLANYNKFESQNLYQNRLEDFVNENTIAQVVDGFANACSTVRNQYVAVQDDAPVPWTISSTLSMVGLRSITPDGKGKPSPPTEEEAKVLFNNLPSAEAAIILSAYSFVDANKIFVSQLISTQKATGMDETHFASFLSMASYLCHHAHRANRALTYATLSLLILRLISEDQILMKRLCSAENKTHVRMARQRPPLLPSVDKSRIPATAMLDICSDSITHNLRKRLSVPLYSVTISTMLRIISHLDSTKTRLQHHWSQTWGSLLTLLRFLTQYQSDLTSSSSIYQVRNDICAPLTCLLAFCLSRGDNFLPDPASYDDLFYKLIEASGVLQRFKAAYCPDAPPPSSTTHSTNPHTDSHTMLFLATNALLSVTSHYQSLLTSRSKTHQSPATVQKVIREGYDTLPDIGVSPVPNGSATNRVVDFGHWEKWRDSTWKSEIKKFLRVVVEDAKSVCLATR